MIFLAGAAVCKVLYRKQCNDEEKGKDSVGSGYRAPDACKRAQLVKERCEKSGGKGRVFAEHLCPNQRTVTRGLRQVGSTSRLGSATRRDSRRLPQSSKSQSPNRPQIRIRSIAKSQVRPASSEQRINQLSYVEERRRIGCRSG